MIGWFRSKALRNLWGKEDPSGVNPNALTKIKRIFVDPGRRRDEAMDLKDYHGS